MLNQGILLLCAPTGRVKSLMRQSRKRPRSRGQVKEHVHVCSLPCKCAWCLSFSTGSCSVLPRVLPDTLPWRSGRFPFLPLSLKPSDSLGCLGCTAGTGHALGPGPYSPFQTSPTSHRWVTRGKSPPGLQHTLPFNVGPEITSSLVGSERSESVANRMATVDLRAGGGRGGPGAPQDKFLGPCSPWEAPGGQAARGVHCPRHRAMSHRFSEVQVDMLK